MRVHAVGQPRVRSGDGQRLHGRYDVDGIRPGSLLGTRRGRCAKATSKLSKAAKKADAKADKAVSKADAKVTQADKSITKAESKADKSVAKADAKADKSVAKAESKADKAVDVADKNAVGATASCNDGTYSHAKTHQGACSGHKGVAKFLK